MNRSQKIALILSALGICAGGALFLRTLDWRRQMAKPSAIYEPVWRQIEAFRESDYSRAYRHASSGFQERFNIEAFTEMIRTNYPDVARARRVEFAAVQFTGRRALVQVFFILPEGDVVPCVYTLIEEDGAWKIDGARLEKRWGEGRRLGGMRT